jgi:hypothetical protein
MNKNVIKTRQATPIRITKKIKLVNYMHDCTENKYEKSYRKIKPKEFFIELLI